MDHCDWCGFTYGDHGAESISDEIASLGGRFEALLAAPSSEYGCHVRDVLLAQRERLLLALVEDEPTFVPIYRDQRADLARYSDEPRRQVAREITFASDLLAWVLTGLDVDAWNRTCVYNFPESSVRTVMWLAQHTLHEGEHHLRDIIEVTSG